MRAFDEVRTDEAEALQMIMRTPGMRVILSQLEARAAGIRPVDINDPQWAQKAAHREGEIKSLREFKTWLEGRLTAQTRDPVFTSPTEA